MAPDQRKVLQIIEHGNGIDLLQIVLEVCLPSGSGEFVSGEQNKIRGSIIRHAYDSECKNAYITLIDFFGHSIILMQWETYNVKNTYITLDTSEKIQGNNILYIMYGPKNRETRKITDKSMGIKFPTQKSFIRVQLYKNSHSSAVGALTLQREPNSREMSVSLCIEIVKSFIVQSSETICASKNVRTGTRPLQLTIGAMQQEICRRRPR
jgi:hypothetical protein